MNLRKCAGGVKSLAKSLWIVAYVIRLLGAAIAIVVAYKGISQNEAQAAILLLIFSVASLVSQYLYSMVRGVAEQLKRMSELSIGLGIPKDEQLVQDALAMPVIRLKAAKITMQSAVEPDDALKVDYYVTTEPIGAQRLAEMIHESAWFSANHAKRLFSTLVVLFIVMTFVGLIGLYLFGSGGVQLANTLDENNKQISLFVAVIASFLISAGIFESALQYYQFYKTSESVVTKLASFISAENPSPSHVLSIVAEYHIARNSSPILPDWLHKRVYKELDDAYEKIYNSIKTEHSPVEI